MLATEPEAASNPLRPGFRLDRFEVLNWGTLHQRVWGLSCRSDNALLTGDIGSGKSTLVDAISTLLVAPQKITYNKAAGADARERTPRTYVLGHYKSERGDPGLAAKPIALRDSSYYSVLLGRFTNEQLGIETTLAQVFWWRDTSGQPARFYVVGDAALSIGEHFGGFGKSMDTLRKRLRAMPAVELFDTFPPYAIAYRRRFGIESEQAMDLFYQTVSMKSVGNLTEFVRAHMLEAFDVDDRITALVHHFDDLTRAHEAVVKAKKQIGLLAPLLGDCDKHGELVAHTEELRACRDALKPWFARLKGELLDERIASLETQARRLDDQVATLFARQQEQSAKCDTLKQSILQQGGERLSAIGQELEQRQLERDVRKRREARYAELAGTVDLPLARDAETFHVNRSAIATRRDQMASREIAAQNAVTDATVEVRALKEKHDAVTGELESLRRRRSNVPAQMLAIRQRLCDALSLEEDVLPFAGELIQVRAEARDWEGAIERLLHNFGLSLLVPDSMYQRVAAWVDRNHLRGRLVYYRTRESVIARRVTQEPRSVAARLQIEPHSPFYSWLTDEIANRFDHTCCDTIEELRRARKGLTRAGQIKGSGERHEKDDRHAVDDRTRYVLGWSNEGKVAALEKQERAIASQGHSALAKCKNLEAQQHTFRDGRTTLDRLQDFESFRELDWQTLAAEIEQLAQERAQLEETLDILRTLREQLEAAQQALQQTAREHEACLREQGSVSSRRITADEQRADCAATLGDAPKELQHEYFPKLELIRRETPGHGALSVESCDKQQQEMRESMQRRIDSDETKRRVLEGRIVSAMRSYMDAYPLETREVDAALESASEFTAISARLTSDDLPRFEARFKDLLNENTIREVANFQSQLNRERQSIRERIDRINQSLHGINYNPGRFIVLEADSNIDPEVRDFQLQLRACTEGTLTGSDDDAYSEAKFLEVKRIIERFRGREGSTELDRRWTRKVTDVRNWYLFSASERWREDGTEYEHYTDSGGKSGGQKEKLAYTVLAASLAYQFGLDAVDNKARTFRFVVIDEAFGRGSDDSARYGLELFRRLNLQLLVVTPLQMIHIIEPFVASVGFIHNPDGNASMLRNLTIEEYRAERAALHA